jgi:hypothetical protein
MTKENDALGEALFAGVLNDLLKRVQSGEASAADISNAIKFLKDNNITGSSKKIPNLAALAGRVLPFAKEA